MKRVEPQNILLLLIIGLIVCSVIVYFSVSPAIARDIASFLSGISTLGILGLTAFYVIYTNRQILELQKQRQLQMQPLPNVSITEAGIISPRLVTDPYEKGKISLTVQFELEVHIKNIGNGTAVLVDNYCFFTGRDFKRRQDFFSADRHLTIELNQSVTASQSIKDTNIDGLVSLNKNSGDGCPAKQAFDLLIAYEVLYKNILGQGFLSSTLNTVVIGSDDQRKISHWIGAINSFDKEYASEISKYNAIYSRNRKEAMDVFDAIATSFYSKCRPEVVDIQVLPLSKSFKIKALEPEEFEKISRRLHHGIPLGRLREDKELAKKTFLWKKRVLSNRFMRYASSEGELESPESGTENS